MSLPRQTRIADEDVGLVVARALAPDAKVVDYRVEPYSKVKSGILSSHYELSVNVRIGIEEAQKHTFFVKTSGFIGTDENVPIFCDDFTFTEEVYFFNEVYPTMKKVMHDQLRLPKCWLAKNDMLIFEDLRTQGYSMPVEIFSENDRLRKVASSVAKFHASGILIETYLGKPLNQAYADAFKEKLYAKHTILWDSVTATIKMASALADYFNLPVATSDKVNNWLTDNVKSSTTELNVLCHGDIWRNNIMVKDNDLILVDYQLMRYCSPGVDLAMLMYLNCPGELRESSEREIIQCYYDTLKETLENHSLDAPVPSFENIWAAYEAKKLFGAVYASMYLPGMILPPEKFVHIWTDATCMERFFLKERLDIILPEIKNDPIYADKVRAIIEEYVRQVNKVLH